MTSELQVLTTVGWRAVVPDISSPHRTTQLYVAAVMAAAHAMSPQQVSKHTALFVDHNNVTLRVLRLERHRCCTVAYCLQNAARYIVYGIVTNADSRYGIGTSLECITAQSSEQYCPRNITARHIEAM